MPYYRVVATFGTEDDGQDDSGPVASVIEILNHTLPYMVDNVTVEIEEI